MPNPTPELIEKKNRSDQEIKKTISKKEILGFFDKLKGLKSLDEKKCYQEIQKLQKNNQPEEAKQIGADFVRKNPEATVIKKLITKIEKKEKSESQTPSAQKDGNVFTKLFKTDGPENKSGSIIDNIVKQSQNQKEQENKKKAEALKNNSTENPASFLTSSNHSPEIEIPPTQKIKSTSRSKLIGIIILTMTVLTYCTFWIILDRENRVLSSLGIENTGFELSESQQEISKIKKNIKKISAEIANLKQHVEISAAKEKMTEIKKERVDWSSILNEVQLITAKTPGIYLNNINYWSYAGKAEQREISLSGEVKHERMFTLMANLIDTINNDRRFSNFNYRSFTQGTEEEDSKQLNVSLKFNFKTDQDLAEEDSALSQ